MNARAAALHREPLQSLSEVTETTEEFRRVRVEGEMIKNSIRVGPKVRTSEVSNNEKIAGYDLITPMREKRNKNARGN
jgi:cytochrome oxidase assembly protein ShyY1